MYKLKANFPDFEVMDGPYAGRKYRAGQVYTEIPADERHKFEPEFPSPYGNAEGEQRSEGNSQ